jgi:hypothetical protein
MNQQTVHSFLCPWADSSLVEIDCLYRIAKWGWNCSPLKTQKEKSNQDWDPHLK